MVHRVLPVVTLAFFGAALSSNPPQQNQKSQQAVPTLKTTARLVYVDVVVRDKAGQPVHGLKKEDFALLENGKSQTFQEFQEHAAPTAEQIAKMPQLPPGIFSNADVAVTARPNGSLNVLLLDRTNTAKSDQEQMKTQINDYLLHAPPGQRMAIFGLTDHLVMLQGFTTDSAAIEAALNGRKGLESTGLLSPPVEMLFGAEGATASMNQDDSDQSRGPTQAMNSGTDVNHSRERVAADQVELRATSTLDAMAELARYLGALPGRKNLIWLSGSFPIDIMPSMVLQTSPAFMSAPHPGGGDNPFETVMSQEEGFDQTSALLSRAQVAVYPIDVKGLKIPSGFTADDKGFGDTAATLQAISDFGDHNFAEHSTMNELANRTGGKAFINTNDFSAAMGGALDDGANYYTIAYSPSDPTWDGRFRGIEVRLRQKGYTLRYRKGYFAQEVKEQSGSKPMSAAMMHGGPEPAEVVFSARVRPASAAQETTAAPNNQLGSGAKGPFRRYRVEFAVAPEQVKLNQTPDGHRHAALEFAVCVYDKESKLVDSIDRSIQADIVPDAYAQFQQNGIPYQEDVSVPTQGEYSLRIVMHDQTTDHVGAVEIPVASVSGLQPLEASAK